jgi:hypothetical protein
MIYLNTYCRSRCHVRADAASLPLAAAVCPCGLRLRGSGCSSSRLPGNIASIGRGHPPPSVGGHHLASGLLPAGQVDVLDLGMRVSVKGEQAR